jgi:transcriptional regulator with XRE-family HTH domain
MIATMDAAALVKQARREAGLSQESLAARAGVTRQAVALIECRARRPSLRMLTGLLAAAGVQMRVELEPLDADVRRELEAGRADPERAKDALQVWGSLFAIDEVVCRVEGVAAAALLGAPVSVPAIDVAFADTDATYSWLADQIRSAVKVRLPGADRPIDVGLPRDADHGRERDGALVRARIAAECPDGRFLLDAWFDTLRARMATPEEVARHVVVATSRGPISVQPLDEIATSDGDVARVLRVMREHGASARGTPG